MKRLVYFSAPCFFDVDFPVLTELKKNYEITFVSIFTLPNGYYSEIDFVKFCKNNAITHLSFQLHYRFRDVHNIIKYFEILKKIKNIKADVYYFEFLGAPYFHLLTSFYIPKNKVVIALHDVEDHVGVNNPLIKKIYKKFLMSWFDYFHLFSLSQKEIFIKNYFSKVVMYAPLMLKDFGPKKIPRLQNKKLTFLFFGTIRANKGLEILIYAGNLLSAKRNDFTIVIAGFCDDFNGYRSLIKKETVFDLQIRKINNDEISEIFSRADYLVLPYKDVTQSGPLLIAYNYCVPVIASNLPGFKEYIIDKENGFLFESCDANSLASCLEVALNMSNEEREVMESKLMTFLDDNLNKQKIIQRYRNFFDKNFQ